MRLWVSGLESGVFGKIIVVKILNGSTWFGFWWLRFRRDFRREYFSFNGSCFCFRTVLVISVRRYRVRVFDEIRKV